MRTLLPEDAVLAGAWGFGDFFSTTQDVEEWMSADLGVRYRLLGEGRSGSILMIYTHAGKGYEDGPIERIEPRSAQTPR